MIRPSFKNHCIISCGMLHPELTHLTETGFLSPRRIYFTPPGLHAIPERLEEHLLKRLTHAREWCSDHQIIVVYGKKCHVSVDEPLKRVDTILQEVGQDIIRVQGDYGYDMLAGSEDRQRISAGRQDKILWFTPGWLRSWKPIYQRYLNWDEADANANFPGYYDKIIVLDGINLSEKYITQHAEEIMELFDWTGLEIEFHPITLDRFKRLLIDALLGLVDLKSGVELAIITLFVYVGIRVAPQISELILIR
ncbi:MAG: DUF1638 domain-containing protein [Anaerolineales bacterium]|jgi:hypothetical protein